MESTIGEAQFTTQHEELLGFGFGFGLGFGLGVGFCFRRFRPVLVLPPLSLCLCTCAFTFYMRVAVVGAGVGALAMRRRLLSAKPNWDVVVYAADQEPPENTPPESDRALGIWPRAWNAIADLHDRLEPLATVLPPAAYRNINGTWLSQAPLNAPERVAAVRESDLRSALLRTPTTTDSDVRWGCRVAGVDVDEGNARKLVVRIDGGEREGPFDVCVGADGARSVVRLSVAGEVSTPVGTVSEAGWISADDVRSLQLDGVPPFEVLAGRGRRLAFVPAGGHGDASFFATFPLASAHDEVAPMYADVFHPVPDLFARAVHALRRDVHFEHARPMYAPRQNVALVGDAANSVGPNLAQGAAAAIEDASVLARLLARCDDDKDVGAALQEYSAARSRRAARHRRVTAFTAMLAHRALDGWRDIMALVPQPINGAIFRAALTHSLGPDLDDNDDL